MENNKYKGYVFLPYIIKNIKTDINGETVWYANKFKNFLLKIKHFFVKPKYLKNAHIYKNTSINPSFYTAVSLSGNEKTPPVTCVVCGGGDIVHEQKEGRGLPPKNHIRKPGDNRRVSWSGKWDVWTCKCGETWRKLRCN